jgi:hypothetical protein
MDPRVVELHSIMPVANVGSVMAHGILSHARAQQVTHQSVAMPEVQDRRAGKIVPRAAPLHHYANLYFHARNPMLYKRKDVAETLCILRVSTEVLKKDGVVITDLNAASPHCRFLAPSQWQLLNFDDIYAASWTYPDDPKATWWHRLRKCAEVLVPDRIEPRFLIGAYVMNEAVLFRLRAAGWALPCKADPEFFFRGDR